MGLGCDAVYFLIDLKNQGLLPNNGAVMEIGAQQLANHFLKAVNELDALGKLFDIKERFLMPDAQKTDVVHGNLRHQDESAPMAREFWRWLGYRYAAIDIDGHPDSIAIDLNYDSIPPSHKGQYDLVTNFGTTEHIANQLNAFKVIHNLTKPGGIMMHHVPAQGMVNHGLINYNPKFFWMLARSNGYKYLSMYFFSDTHAYALPTNITDMLKTYEWHKSQTLADYKTTDCHLVVFLQKQFDIDFVAPIDVPTGAVLGNKKLEERYWTVFQPNAFAKLRIQSKGRRVVDFIKRPFNP